MADQIALVRRRLDAVFHGVEISRKGRLAFGNGAAGRGRFVVVVRGAGPGSRARIVALAAPAHLEFYDWEANLLLPDGRTVASLGPALSSNPQAVALSQGAGAAPGSPGSGGMSLYEALALASKQPVHVSPDKARQGLQYYMFGAPGPLPAERSTSANGSPSTPGEHCLIAGPASSVAGLASAVPAGVIRAHGRVLAVP